MSVRTGRASESRGGSDFKDIWDDDTWSLCVGLLKILKNYYKVSQILKTKVMHFPKDSSTDHQSVDTAGLIVRG